MCLMVLELPVLQTKYILYLDKHKGFAYLQQWLWWVGMICSKCSNTLMDAIDFMLYFAIFRLLKIAFEGYVLNSFLLNAIAMFISK